MSSTQSPLSDFENTSEPDDEVEWPISVNGHCVHRVEPNHSVRGSGDNKLAFECEFCQKHIIPAEFRSVSDVEWARNRFSLESCSSSGSGIV